MQQAPLAFAITRGPAHTLFYANDAFRLLAGLTDADLLGGPVVSSLVGSAAADLSSVLDHSFLGTTELVEVRVGALMCSVWPVGIDGSSSGLGLQLRHADPDGVADLQRQVAEKMLLGALRERGLAEDAEKSRRRSAFLAESGRLLAESVDRSDTLVALTKLALPTPGDWCVVDVLEEGDAIHRLAIYHPDVAKQRLASELATRWAPEADDPFGAAPMLRNVETIAITNGIDDALAAAAHGSETLDILHRLGIASLISVPLVARRKLLGAITFVTSGRGYGPAEVLLAKDIAHQAALALDNARMYDEAVHLKEAADTANKAKTAFLGSLSHELRTPLNAIGGYIDLIDMGLRGPVTEAQHLDFARVKRSQQHLVLLITEILNFVRVGSGNVSYAIADVNALNALAHAVSLIEPLFGQRGIAFDGISGDPDIVARADFDRVTQILVNLLSNAIKFTQSGGHIGAQCSATGEVVTIQIFDTGIGIAPEKIETVFEPFVQLRDGLADRASGVGLGLAISRDLARAMKGELSVTSDEGKGSRFTLTLPRAVG